MKWFDNMWENKNKKEDIIKNKQTNKCTSIHKIIQLITTKTKMKMKKDHIYTTQTDLGLDMDT